MNGAPVRDTNYGIQDASPRRAVGGGHRTEINGKADMT